MLFYNVKFRDFDVHDYVFNIKYTQILKYYKDFLSFKPRI